MLIRALMGLIALSAIPNTSAALAGEGLTPPLVVVGKLMPTETSADVWSRPASITAFTARKGGRPTQQTEARLAYDDENFYVAFRCFEEHMDRLRVEYTKEGDPVWRDDSIEVFLDTRMDRKTFFQMVSNAAGVGFQNRGRYPEPGSWSGKWSVEVSREDKAWTALVTVPFESLETTAPQPGMIWSAQFGRSERPVGELSSWSPVMGGFVEPESFGLIMFADADAPAVSMPTVEIGAPGRYPVMAKVSNPGTANVRLRMEVISGGRILKQLQQDFEPGDSEWDFDFRFPYEGKHHVSIAFTDASTGELIMRTPSMAANVPPFGARLNKYREIVRSLLPAPPELADEMTAVRKTLGELVAYSRTAQGSAVMWRHFGDKLDAVDKNISSLRYECSDREGRGYVVGAETSVRKVFRHKLFEGTIGEPAAIGVARNEYESAQAVIIAHGKALERVSVSVAPLEGPGGAVIPAERITLNLVDYVKTRKPRYEVDYVGWYPDPLMDMKPFDVPEGGIQPVWTTVHPAEDAPAGVYRGQVVFKPENAPETVLPLEVRVWDFTLPTKPTMKTAFALFPHELGTWYGGMSDDIRRAYYEFLLQRRLNPTNIYSGSPTPSKEDLPFCVEHGLNAFCLAYTHDKNDAGRAQLLNMLRDYESYLKEKGWWDMAYIYGFDEIPREKYPELRSMYGWLKEQMPDLPRMCTVIPNEELRGYVDIWVPVTSNYDRRDAEEYTKAGDEVWWYVCCNPHPPYANFFIDSPDVDPRIIFWMNWKYRVPGFLYYALNNWTTNRAVAGLPHEHRAHDDPDALNAMREGKRWPEVPWNTFTFDDFNGDGHLIYPGPGGKPLSSIRLELIRDGIEDYEYFCILNDLVEKAEKASGKVDPAVLSKARLLLAVDSGVVESLTRYTHDPDVLLNARREVAETIEMLQPAVDG